MPKCRGCGASIVWVESAAGRRIPCDPEPWVLVDTSPRCDAQARVERVVTRDGRVVAGTAVMEFIDDPSGLLGSGLVAGRRAHWATCPVAARFRRPAAGGAGGRL